MVILLFYIPNVNDLHPFFLSFKANATRISTLMRDSNRTPVQEAADWIEYVHRHGGARQ